MGKFHRTFTAALGTLITAVSLAACGGDAGGTATVASATVQAAAHVVNGVATTGAPIAGTVFVNYTSPNARSAPINQDGTFTLDVSGWRGPYFLKAVDPQKNCYYSFANATGRTNINPLTTATVVKASGSTDLKSLSALYDKHDHADVQKISDGMSEAYAALSASLNSLLANYGAEKTDAVSGAVTVNHQGLDGFFDQIAVTIENGALTATNRTTQASILAADGTPITGNIPLPSSYYSPGNAELTLQVQGNLAPDTLVRNLSFTLQLPLGVTIDPGSSVINTAIPIAGAKDSIVYPAPSLSATNNRLNVTLSSLAGFGTGDFLTIRCIVSSFPLANTSATDFSVLDSTMFADIYRNQPLKNLSIVPTGIAFPPRRAIRSRAISASTQREYPNPI